MQIQPMRQSGTCQNITYYAEQGPEHGYIWAEVIRDDYKRTGRGPAIRRSIPSFWIVVRRDPNLPVTEFRYEPKTKPRTERLSPLTITRLIRAREVTQ